MALPTNGRVIIETTAGDIDIELWSKETPKTCRNFLALAMEGYYDDVIFHRIMPGFLVQTGDRTGTGNGGESFYGEPFEDEIHPRLRYAHRGLVGMANSGTKNSNDSQFFITLDRADELHGKHTLFGRCMGDTVYNAIKIGEMEIDKEGRPVYPPKIKSMRIVDNPFNDVIPRITAAERKAQLKAKEDGQREREEEQRRRGAKKNVKLLSFGADEEENDLEEMTTALEKKAIFRQDLVDTRQYVGAIPDFVSKPPIKKQSVEPSENSPNPEPTSKSSMKKDKSKDEDITKIREKHANDKSNVVDSHRAQIERMEADIRKLSRRTAGDLSDDDSGRKKPKTSYLAEQLAKYSKGRGFHSKKGKQTRKKDESNVLAAMSSFTDKLRNTMQVGEDGGGGGGGEGEVGENAENNMVDGVEGDDRIEVDDDYGFMTHALNFPKGNEEEVGKAERDYEVIDPRARGAQAKEEERERKRLKAGKQHGGGSGRRGHSQGGSRSRR